eukprot:403355405
MRIRPGSKGPSFDMQRDPRRDWDNRQNINENGIQMSAGGSQSHVRQNSRPSIKSQVQMEPGGIRANKKGSVVRTNYPKQQNIMPESVRSNDSKHYDGIVSGGYTAGLNLNQQHSAGDQPYLAQQKYQAPPTHVPRIRKGFQIQNINKKSVNINGGVAANVGQKRAASRKSNQRPTNYTGSGPGAYQQATQQIPTQLINHFKEELLATWDSYITPDYHRTVFLDSIYGLNSNQYLPIIAKEIEDLQQEQAPIQNTIRAIIARESCIQQIKELDRVLQEAEKQNSFTQGLMDECIKVLHSLRMLSLHVVKCIIEWRKQLIYSFLLTTSQSSQQNNNSMMHQERNSVNKFKSIPFIWESENYLLKMKNDTQFLNFSEYAKHFNFSQKSDTFLVFPSQKHNAVGGGAHGLKNLKKQISAGAPGQQNQQMPAQSVNVKKDRNGLPISKLTVPLPNTLMKLIRQSEVYLMEEAVTDQILKTTSQNSAINHSNNIQSFQYQQFNESEGPKQIYDQDPLMGQGINFSEFDKENTSDVLNMINQGQQLRGEIKSQQSQKRYQHESKQQQDIIDIKTHHNQQSNKNLNNQPNNTQSKNILQYHQEHDEMITPISEQINFQSPIQQQQNQYQHQQLQQQSLKNLQRIDGNSQANLIINNQQQEAKPYQLPVEDDQKEIKVQQNTYKTQKELNLDDNLQVFGWQIHETQISNSLFEYYQLLDKDLQQSLASISILVDSMNSGFDMHYLVVKQTKNSDNIRGLIAFNVDNMIQKQTQKQTKVNLYHASAVNMDKFEHVLDLALEYIWTQMHCASIKFSLYHYEDANGKLAVNTNIKNLLKSKGFKWKTVTNDVVTGKRVEIMECQNTKHKEYLDLSNCQINRAGLKREDLNKEPFQFKMSQFITVSSSQSQSQTSQLHPEVQSVCGVLNNLIHYKQQAYQNQKDSMSQLTQDINTNLSQDLKSVLEKAEKLRQPFQLPGALTYYDTNVDSSILQMREKQIMQISNQMLQTQQVEALIGSSCSFEARFGSIDTTKLIINNKEYKYLRIKKNPVSFASTQDFEHIIILSNTEDNLNMVILIKNKAAGVNLENMHTKIRQSLNSKPIRNSNFERFMVENQSDQPLFIQDCYDQFSMELYAPPISEGTPDISIKTQEQREEAFIVDRPFYLAVTHGQLEESIEAPMFVAYIDQTKWKLNQ